MSKSRIVAHLLISYQIIVSIKKIEMIQLHPLKRKLKFAKWTDHFEKHSFHSTYTQLDSEWNEKKNYKLRYILQETGNLECDISFMEQSKLIFSSYHRIQLPSRSIAQYMTHIPQKSVMSLVLKWLVQIVAHIGDHQWQKIPDCRF